MKLKERFAIKYAKGHCSTAFEKLDSFLLDIRAFAFEAGFEKAREMALQTYYENVEDPDLLIKNLGEEEV